MKNMEQVKGYLNLQFFAEPGEGTGNPPSDDNGNDGYADNNGGQAETPSTNVSENQGQFTPEQYQNAIRGMNQAQQEAAAYRKLGLSPEQIQEQQQFIQSLQQNPQQYVNDYLQQNPQAFQTVLQQRMGLQQQLEKPSLGVSDIDDPEEYGNKLVDIAVDRAVQKALEKLNPEIAPLKQTLQQQKETAIKANVNGQIANFVKTYPDSGITQESVWKAIQSSNIPLEMLSVEPALADMAIIKAAGGLQQYNEKIGNSKVQKHQQEIIDNTRSTAQLTPGGGTMVREIPAISTNRNQLKEQARAAYLTQINQSK